MTKAKLQLCLLHCLYPKQISKLIEENRSMKVMILAAGRGERMRPLTDTCPKPLLTVGNLPLIGHHLKRLYLAGFRDVVINHAWLGHMIEAKLGNGQDYGVNIAYSAENSGGLETGGGIATALPLLGDKPFLVVNGDVLTDIDFSKAFAIAQTMQQSQDQAYLWLVDNPAHHPQGDFGLTPAGRVTESQPAQSFTFSGVGVYQPALFNQIAPHTRAKLAPLLRTAIASGQVRGEHHQGLWLDVGTIERLEQANQIIEQHLL